MKDAFGRTVEPNDIVVYATRSGSMQFINVARVKEIVSKEPKWRGGNTEFIRAECIAGSGYTFIHGRSKWDGKALKTEPYVSRNVTLSAGDNMIVVNGIDTDAIVLLVQTRQAANIAAAEARRNSSK